MDIQTFAVIKGKLPFKIETFVLCGQNFEKVLNLYKTVLRILASCQATRGVRSEWGISEGCSGRVEVQYGNRKAKN